MFATSRVIARRRTHDATYALIAALLVVLALLYPLVPIGFFSWAELVNAGPHAWAFMALLLAPSAFLLAMLVPVYQDWALRRPYVPRGRR